MKLEEEKEGVVSFSLIAGCENKKRKGQLKMV
jgi:hypothetical protein